MKRRDFLRVSALAAAAAAVPGGAYLLRQPRPPRARAKSLVVLFMTGGPSQMELFDHKPELYRRNGQTVSGFADEKGKTEGTILAPVSRFTQHGRSGQWVSDLLPRTAALSDELTFIKSVNGSSNNHALAQMEFLTGNISSGHPFAGAWINHALPQRRSSLPGAIVMTDPLGPPRTNSFAWESGQLRHAASKVVFSEVGSFRRSLRRFFYDEKEQYERFLRQLEASSRLAPPTGLDETALRARLENMALIYSAREELRHVLDLGTVTEEERALYGMDQPLSRNLAEQLLVARRLVEAEVPYVQIFCGNEEDPTSWDHHATLDDIFSMSKKIDHPVSGFLVDLKRRGLLDHTIVLWGGEFGRLPVRDMDQPDFKGRNHNERANSIWLTGAGIKKGFSYGETDELSMRTVKDRVEMGDVWATIMHLMGIRHDTLVSPQSPLRLTRHYHRVLHEILA